MNLYFYNAYMVGYVVGYMVGYGGVDFRLLKL